MPRGDVLGVQCKVNAFSVATREPNLPQPRIWVILERLNHELHRAWLKNCITKADRSEHKYIETDLPCLRHFVRRHVGLRHTRRYAMKHAKGQESSLAATEVTTEVTTEVKVYPPCQVVSTMSSCG